MNRKGLDVGLILLLIGTSAIPSTALDIEEPSLPTSSGNWLYVGGSGPGNFTKIQDAVDKASDGDTVFVYDDSSPYDENITVDKSIIVQGENMYTTIITDGGFSINGIDHVILADFTIQRAPSDGVFMENSSNDIIENCIFYQNAIGLQLRHRGENNIIRNCIFNSNLWIGVYLNGFSVNNNEIYYCDIFNNGLDFNPYCRHGGIVIEPSYGTKIHHCNINNNEYVGVGLVYCGAQITSNNIVNNSDEVRGISISGGFPFSFCDMSHNWWGAPQGPNIKIYFLNFNKVIRDVGGNQTVHLYGIWSLKSLFHLRPWLIEPVPDAGLQTLDKERMKL